MKKRPLVLFALAALLLVVLPARAGTVYRPGLWQASLSGSANWTDDILAAANVERVPGTMMAEITTSTNNPVTGTTCTWGGNQTWGYVGQMFMRAGVVYHFYKFVDDNGNYVVDGTTILKNHTTYNAFAHCQYTPETTGWKDVDLRFGNGSGGAGRSGLFGAGWNTNNITANQLAGWEHIADPGDCSLLRVPTGESFSGAASAGMRFTSAGLSLVLSHTNLPAGAKLYALTDTVDRGTDLVSDWAGVEDLGSVPSGTGEETVLFADAVPTGFMRLVVVSRGLSSNAFLEWLDPVDLTSVASDGALAFGATVTSEYETVDVSVVVPSLGTASSVALRVELSASSDFSSTLASTNLPAAVAAWATETAHFGSLSPNTAYWVRVTATPDVGDPVVKTYQTTTKNPGPIFTASVDTEHLAPDISLSFTDIGRGDAVTKITVQVSTSASFASLALNKDFAVRLDTMPTNVSDIALTGYPRDSVLYFRFIARNAAGYEETVDKTVSSSIGGNNVWSGLSEDIADPGAYVFAGGLPASDKTLFFTTPAGLSPVIDRDTTMPSLRFTNGKNESVETDYRKGYHSCGYNLAGRGVLTFTVETPILQASYGTNVIGNPILFSRSNSQTVKISSVGENNAWLRLDGSLRLPAGVSNTTMSITGRGNTVLGGASPDFMGQLSVEGGRLTFASPFAMTNASKFYFSGDPTSMSNAIGAPLVFPRASSIRMENGWTGRKLHVYGSPFVFPQVTFEWGIRDYDQSTFDADWVVSNVVVRKHGSNGEACGTKTGTGAFIVKGETTWYDPSVKSYIKLYSGCFWAQTPAGLPPSGDFFAPNGNSYYWTLGLGGDYSPMLDGSSTPRVFQSSAAARWGFTGFGGDRTVCWNGDSSLNLTNTTSDNVSIRLSAAATATNSVNKAYGDYYAYPARFMFGNRSAYADGTVLFLNPIRYEFGQSWDTSTFFESTNHVVAARMRGSLKLGSRDKTWNFSGRNFGGYLALEAENADFTGKVNVHEKGNLLVNSNLVARSATVQTGSGLGGTGTLSTEDGTAVKNGGALFGGEWNKGGTLTLGGKVTFESGSAVRAEVGASNDRIGRVKLAAGSTLKLGSPVYVDVDTDPRVSPVRGAAVKILDWSEAFFDSGAAPTRADFTPRPESNADLETIYVFTRDDGLYINYLTVRYPQPTIMLLR